MRALLFFFCLFLLGVNGLAVSHEKSLLKSPLRIAVLAPPEMGHYNSLSGLIEELLSRGHNITLFLSKPCHNWVQIKNITVVDAGDAMPQKMVDAVSHMHIVDVLFAGLDILVQMDSPIIEALDREYKNNPPDLIVSDLILRAGIHYSRLHKIPLVLTCPFVYPNPWVRPTWNPIITSGLPLSKTFFNRFLNFIAIMFHRWIVWTSMSFWVETYAANISIFGEWEFPTIVTMHWGVDHAFKLPPYVFYVGSTRNYDNYQPLSPGLEEWFNKGNDTRHIIYISMGTVSYQTAEEIGRILEGLLADQEWRVLWALRQDLHKHVQKFCDQSSLCSEDIFRLEPYVSQLAVLAHPSVKLFVTHGGANSMLESIRFTKPLVCMPLFGDQHDMCQRAVDKGFGLRVDPKSMSPRDLTNAIRKVLKDDKYLRIVESLNIISRAAGGAPRAADIVESVSATGYDYLLPYELQMPWYQRWDLDIYGTLLVLICAVYYSCSAIFKSCVLKRGRSESSKTLKKKSK